jgi:rhodanese-related sulfurtransferase
MAVVLSLGLIGLSVKPLIADDIVADAPRITKEELKSRLGDPDIIILDVLVQDQWETVDQKIKGAVHENPEEVDSWASKYPKDKTYVLY